MTIHCLADRRLAGTDLGEVVEMFVTRPDAERALEAVLHDEPGFIGHVYLLEIELVV